MQNYQVGTMNVAIKGDVGVTLLQVAWTGTSTGGTSTSHRTERSVGRTHVRAGGRLGNIGLGNAVISTEGNRFARAEC
jgi:hypothetical protein